MKEIEKKKIRKHKPHCNWARINNEYLTIFLNRFKEGGIVKYSTLASDFGKSKTTIYFLLKFLQQEHVLIKNSIPGIGISITWSSKEDADTLAKKLLPKWKKFLKRLIK